MMKASQWTAIDKGTIDLVRHFLRENKPEINARDLAKLLDCSEARLYRIFHYSGTPLTVGEFTSVCTMFGKNPADEYSRILSLAEQDKPALQRTDLLVRRIEDALTDFHRKDQ